MTADQRERPSETPWRIFLSVFCIVLLLVIGTAAAVHTHPDNLTHPDCSLCVTAHLSTELVQIPVATPPVAVSVRVEYRAEIDPPVATSIFALFTRPPPAA